MGLFSKRMTSLHDYFERRKHLRRYRRWTPQDEDRLRFYQAFVQPGDLVFDVGANVGNRTKIFSRLGARIVAFEPQEACARVLERATARDPRVTIVRQALGSHPGEAQMLIGSADTTSTLSREWSRAMKDSGRFGGCDWQGEQTVSLITLDQAVAKYGEPAFIKIDVEGYESEVLAGLSRPIHFISIEFNAEDLENARRCVSRLPPHARFQMTHAESMSFDLPAWTDAAGIVQALEGAAAADRLAWGDVYIRCEG